MKVKIYSAVFINYTYYKLTIVMSMILNLKLLPKAIESVCVCVGV